MQEKNRVNIVLGDFQCIIIKYFLAGALYCNRKHNTIIKSPNLGTENVENATLWTSSM